MGLDWIHSSLKRGKATVECKTCGETADFNGHTKTYECDCDFGATIEALAFGLEGYTVEY
jgi:hypothetical protein